MKRTLLKITVGLTLVSSFVGARGVGATTPAFGDARPGGIEVNLGGGTMQRVACAPGAEWGASCYVSR